VAGPGAVVRGSVRLVAAAATRPGPIEAADQVAYLRSLEEPLIMMPERRWTFPVRGCASESIARPHRRPAR
jgi:hypothetical protein